MAEFRYGWLANIHDMQQEMARLLEYMEGAKPPEIYFASSMWEPAVDVYETENEIVVLVELAGVSPDKVRITLDGRLLSIKGAREEKSPHPRKIYHHMEIHKGVFERNILLPGMVDGEHSVTSTENGFLEITLPKIMHEHIVRLKLDATSE